MTDSADFRTRSLEVRRAARARLAELRAKRRAGLPASSRATPSVTVAPLTGPTLVAEPTMSASAEAQALAAEAQAQGQPCAEAGADGVDAALIEGPSIADVATDELSAAVVETSAARDDGEPETTVDTEAGEVPTIEIDVALHDKALETIADAETPTTAAAEPPLPSEPAAVEEASPQPVETTFDAPIEAASSASAAAGSMSASDDLSKLPGVGPGLVWLFAKAGVETLGQLAEADAKALESEIGLIGQLVDIGSWVKFARANIR